MDEYLPKLTERGRRWIRFLGLLAATALLIWIALVLRQILTPIVAALALAYILNPLITMLEVKYKVRRTISVSCGLVLLIVVGSSLLIASTAQVVQFAGNAREYTKITLGWLDETVPGLFSVPDPSAAPVTIDPDDMHSQPPATQSADDAAEQPPPTQVVTPASRLIELASEHGLSVGRTVIGYISGVISNVFYWLSLVALFPLYTFFFLLHFNWIVKTAHDHLPGQYRAQIVQVVATIDSAISAFFRGRLLVCLAVGTLTGLGWLCVGVPYNLALGVLAGTLNLIPFMSVLALPPALILTYLDAGQTGSDWVLAVTLVVAVYMAVQAIESFVLNPTILAKAAGLHAVTTVIALLIGGQVAGLLGMLLAIPIASTLKSLFVDYALPEIRRLAESQNKQSVVITDTSQAEPDKSPDSSQAAEKPPEDK